MAVRFPTVPGFLHTVDGSEISKQPPDMYEATVNNGIWTSNLNWLAGRISSNHQQHFLVKMVSFVGFYIFPHQTSIEVDPSFPKAVDQQKPRFFMFFPHW